LELTETPSQSNSTVTRIRDNSFEADSPPRSCAVAWCVASLLAGALIGLVHDPNYATAWGADLVEDGRGIEDKTVMEGGLNAAQAGRSIGLVLLLASGGLCIWTTARDARFRWDGLSLLMVLGLLWTSASLLWSVERGTTARELVRLFVFAGVAAAIARRFDPRTFLHILAFALGVSVLTAAAFEIVTGGFHPWRGDYRLTGTLHCNVLAVQAVVVALIAYAFAVSRDRRAAMWWTVFFAALILVYFTKARAALISVAVGATAVHFLGRPPRNWLMLGTTAASLVAVALLGATMLGLFGGLDPQNLSTLGRTDDTSALTGRVPLWNYVWQKSAGHRLQGFGWGAFWVVEQTLAARDALGWYPRHSHNAYLHLVINIGFVGLAIVLAIGVWSLARALQLTRLTGRAEFSALTAILVAIFVNGVAESAFVMPRDMGLFAAAVVFSLAVVPRSSVPVAEFARIRTAPRRSEFLQVQLPR
jgi:O-antigen ligase